MEQREIAETLRAEFPSEVVEVAEFQGQVAVVTRRGRILDILRRLRDGEEFRMDHLRALCGVDDSARETAWPERFEVVYELYSIGLRHGIRLRALVPEDDARIASATVLWPGANWPEREVFDLFGIRFTGHPDLRRVLLPEDWVGHPLLKDYPVRGPAEWAVMAELEKRRVELDKHGFYAAHPLDGFEPVAEDVEGGEMEEEP